MPLMAPTVADYEASADLATLLVRTAEGDAFSVPAEKLRLSCKCAHCTRARFDECFPERFPGIAITEIGDLGYGLNISFSDGHNRGIYPKPYLLSLAAADNPAS
ncbi:gamma-butyrobetaine hydroxylase-like domain-containing protein [Bradyrhizobium sp. DASA03076]|uniref:gamma-butyrobetaine hydroxylase-like domain-containing protein n=1 Tax=Bradyrhizobium sp. BLXBL-03 TaxID=3395916 RepID=UPI003F71E87F